jgi:hypothetical protein
VTGASAEPNRRGVKACPRWSAGVGRTPESMIGRCLVSRMSTLFDVRAGAGGRARKRPVAHDSRRIHIALEAIKVGYGWGALRGERLSIRHFCEEERRKRTNTETENGNGNAEWYRRSSRAGGVRRGDKDGYELVGLSLDRGVAAQ